MEILVNRKPKIAFAGVGWIGRNRLQAAAESGSAEIVLISDPSEECLTAASQLVPSCKTTSLFDKILADEEVEGVVIATPSALHARQSMDAFMSGKAVFCQKPLGRNLEEVTKVIDAARDANKLLGVDFSYRHTKAFQSLHSVIRSGELGKIFAVDLKFHNAYGPDKAWFYDIKKSGGGCVLDLGIHLIDLMLYALDFPEVIGVKSSLISKGISVSGKNEVEDYANVNLELANDVTVQLSCSWHLHAGSEAVIEASFFGTHGGVACKNLNGSFYDFTALRYWGTKTETLVMPPDAWGGKALIAWINELSQNGCYNQQALEFLKSAEVLDKIYGRIN